MNSWVVWPTLASGPQSVIWLRAFHSYRFESGPPPPDSVLSGPLPPLNSVLSGPLPPLNSVLSRPARRASRSQRPNRKCSSLANRVSRSCIKVRSRSPFVLWVLCWMGGIRMEGNGRICGIKRWREDFIFKRWKRLIM